MIKPEELAGTDRGSQYQDDTARKNYHEQERDCIRYWQRKGKKEAAIGIENQSNADDDMPLRVISYDGGSYRSHLSVPPAGIFFR